MNNILMFEKTISFASLGPNVFEITDFDEYQFGLLFNKPVFLTNLLEILKTMLVVIFISRD